MHKRFGLRKVFSRWVPHSFTSEQKRVRVDIATQLLAQYEKCDHRQFNEYVTGGDAWIYFSKPDSKEKNKVNGKRPQIARRSRGVLRVLYALFCDTRGLVLQMPLPDAQAQVV